MALRYRLEPIYQKTAGLTMNMQADDFFNMNMDII